MPEEQQGQKCWGLLTFCRPKLVTEHHGAILIDPCFVWDPSCNLAAAIDYPH